MLFNIKFTSSTIKALAKFVQALDKYRFGVVMFILGIVAPAWRWRFPAPSW
jgi:hypothetical protein